MKGNLNKTIVFVIFCITSAILFYNVIWNNPSTIDSKYAVKGELDYSTIDLNQTAIHKLEGECEFYYKKLFSPDSFAQTKHLPCSYITIPGVWNDAVINKEKINGKGYATYHLKIKVQEDGWYGIMIKEFDCAYKIWANSESVTCGTLGTDINSEIPSWQRKEIYFMSKNKEIDIVLQISNFHHRKGGPEDAMYFGTAKAIMRAKNIQLSTDILFIGILIAMAVYHFVLFFYRRKDKSILFFSLISLIISLRIFTSGEKILIEILPNLNWSFAVRLEYITYQWIMPLFAVFLNTLFPNEFKKSIVKTTVIIASISSLFVIFTPVYIFSHTTIFYNPFIAIISLLSIVLFIIAMIRKCEHSFILFMGYFFYIIVVINDILFFAHFFETSYWLPLGMLAMIMSMVFVVSKRTSKAFTLVENLSDSLDRNNKELQQKVKERTAELELLNKNLSNEVNLKNESLEALIISEKKLQESNSTKDKFFSLIAHDLRGPIGNLSVLFNTISSEKITNEIYDDIKLSTQNTYNLVTDLLTWAGNQNNQIKFNPTNISVNDLIVKIKSIFDLNLRNKGISMNITNIKDEMFVYADFDAIYTVFRNLISNAIKFTEPNGTITLNTQQFDDHIKISVTDTGIGIPDEKLKYLFKPGENKISTRGTKKETGTGLGLILCYDFIIANNGKIGVESTIGEGSTFWFTLPMGKPVQNKDFLHIIKEMKLNALIFEDKPINLQVTRNLLEKININSDSATTVEAALEKSNKIKYDFILLDIELPNYNGIYIKSEIRKKYPNAFILAISTYDKNDMKAYNKELSFNDYLKKPLEQDALINSLIKIGLLK